MAGPTVKPGSLPASKPSLDSLLGPTQSAGAVTDPNNTAAMNKPALEDILGPTAPATPPTSAMQTAADWAPDAGGFAGSIIGEAVAGPPGSIAGAGILGGAGQAAKDFIETKILGKPPKDMQTQIADITKEAGKQAAAQGIGLGVFKVLAPVVAHIASAPLKLIQDTAEAAKSELIRPITELLGGKVSEMAPEAAGDAVKQALTQHIQTKYAPFVDAYQKLGTVSKAMPLNDEVRRTFTQGLKNFAIDMSGDNYRVVKKFADDFDASLTGKSFEDVVGNISDARQVALRSGATKQAALLGELQTKANNFLEDETTKLAARIQAGKAAPQELGFLQQLAQQQGAQEADQAKYAKSLASDYLKSKTKISKDYAGFRNFLSNVGEQTRINADRMGPTNFMSAINDVPSEKLVEKMFDPKNASALRMMQTETPEVFDYVVKSKMSQLLQQTQKPDYSLNLVALKNKLDRMPPATRDLLLSTDEMKQLANVVNNPKLQQIDNLSRSGQNKLLKWAVDLTDIMHGANNAVKAFPKTGAAVQQGFGRAVVGAGSVMLDQGEQ